MYRRARAGKRASKRPPGAGGILVQGKNAHIENYGSVITTGGFFIRRSGPDPKGARVGFILDLIPIFKCLAKQEAGRRVREGQDYGLFREFVKAALRPFNVDEHCDVDIRKALKEPQKKAGSRY